MASYFRAVNTQIEEIIASCGLGKLKHFSAVQGGDVNEAYRVETDQETVFLKVNRRSYFPRMFEAEQEGLMLLSNSDFTIPRPKVVGELDDHQFIIMQWIEKGNQESDFWQQFGRSLAQLHKTDSDNFGLEHDNYIGSLQQSNTPHKTWSDFYREQRLRPQVQLASKNGLLSHTMRHGFNALFNRLDEIYPTEKPALVHGDLWGGNLMPALNGTPCIYDPAVYFGHREMDLAMMALFGGFGVDWVNAYNEVYPLENGWQGRLEIGQLYPLMVHVNLFGTSYTRSVETILQKFL